VSLRVSLRASLLGSPLPPSVNQFPLFLFIGKSVFSAPKIFDEMPSFTIFPFAGLKNEQAPGESLKKDYMNSKWNEH